MSLLALGLAACTAAKGPFDPSTMVAPSPDVPPEYREALSIREIEELRPQLRFPITLAVSQPSSGDGWSRAELEIIESWEDPLRSAGFVDRLIVLPESLSGSCGWRMAYHCGVARNRAAAARFHADALLLMAAQTEVETHASPLSILNLTVVGIWLVPAHHRNAVTIIEGSLIDTRNEYLYVFARAHGEASMVRPLAYASWTKASKRSRLAALEEFGRRMIQEVQTQAPPVAPASESVPGGDGSARERESEPEGRKPRPI